MLIVPLLAIWAVISILVFALAWWRSNLPQLLKAEVWTAMCYLITLFVIGASAGSCEMGCHDPIDFQNRADHIAGVIAGCGFATMAFGNLLILLRRRS